MAQVTAILVDTHFALWVRVVPRELRPGERAAIDDSAPRYVSIVSLWEIAVLQTVGRLQRDPALLEPPSGFALLPLHLEHCSACAGLPLHHRDPFDRMLIAQSMQEDWPIVTADPAFKKYPVQVIW